MYVAAIYFILFRPDMTARGVLGRAALDRGSLSPPRISASVVTTSMAQAAKRIELTEGEESKSLFTAFVARTFIQPQ